MLIAGEWHLGTDGVPRPAVLTKVFAAMGNPFPERFLVDSGADRTIFSAALAAKLGIAAMPVPPGHRIAGVAGSGAFVLVDTTLEFTRADGGFIQLRARFAAFTQTGALEYSLLGRDILNQFDLIVSRPRNEVLLLAGLHQYAVQQQ
ncbi:MAG: retroviral-like aspartic protease family protein [Gemmataceae bacterium]|nr:retroviral-like aspartic protease family protein [Gemmataceae bacterium]